MYCSVCVCVCVRDCVCVLYVEEWKCVMSVCKRLEEWVVCFGEREGEGGVGEGGGIGGMVGAGKENGKVGGWGGAGGETKAPGGRAFLSAF